MDSKYRVLLVDDESAVRAGIRTCLDWEQAGYRIVGEASNAGEALRLVDALAVDLVITDISMPQADGFAFLCALKERHPNLPCIIISGFDNFEYAQRAIEFRVLGYLLKPVDPDKLAGLLHSCKNILEKTETLELERNRSHLSQILTHQSSVAPSSTNQVLGNYYLITIYTMPQFCRHAPFTYLEQTVKELISECRVAATNVVAFDAPLYSGVYGVLFHSEDLSVSAYYKLASQLGQRLRKPNPRNPFCAEVILSAGYPFSSTDAFFSAFKQTVKNLKMRPFLQADIYTEAALARKTSQEFKDTLSSANEHLRLLMQNRKFADVKKYISTILCDTNAAYFTPSSARSLISLISSQMSLLVALYDFIVLNQEVELLQSPIFLLQFRNIGELREYMLKVIDRIDYCFSQQKQDDLIHQIKKYLANNYVSDWDLSELAALFYINSSYLSHIFKKKTGMTISLYIENLRIQNACKLLQDTSMPISEIATAVGYSDPNYFTKRFRKKTGSSPGTYRKTYGSNTEHATEC